MSNEANIRSQQCAGQESGTSHSPYRIETRAVHGYNHIDLVHTYGSISTPIFQTATFQHIGVKHSTGYDYTRVSNPTRDELESLVSSLEGAGTTLACQPTICMAAPSGCLTRRSARAGCPSPTRTPPIAVR